MTEKIKRLFLIVTVIALALCVTAFAVACGDKETEEGGTKTPTSLEVTLADGSTLSYSSGTITVTEGQIPTIAAGDFKVSVVYSDGSKEAVTGFTYDASTFTQNSPAGSYNISFAYSGQTAFVTVQVLPVPSTALAALDTETTYSYVYSGAAVDIIAKLDAAREGDNKLSAMIASGKVRLSTEQNLDVRTATDAGDYALQVIAAPGYAWIDANSGEDTEKTICWKIAKRTIPLPTVQGGVTSFEFTGEEITLPVDLHGYDEQITFENGSPTNKATYVNYGNDHYLCQALIKEAYQTNYAFSQDRYIVDVSEWTITPKRLTVPTLVGYKNKTTAEGVDYYHYDYTGSPLAVATSVDNDAVFTVNRNSGSPIQDVLDWENGSYYVSVSLTNSELANNYRWTDGSQVSEVSFNVVVDPIDYVLPAAVASATLCAETDYVPGNTYATESTITLTTDTLNFLTDAGVWLDDYSTITYDDNETSYCAGVKTLNFSFRRSANYNPCAMSLSVTVKKAQVCVNSFSWVGKQNVTDSSIWLDLEEGNFVYNGLPQRKQLDLDCYSYYMMAIENIYPTVTYNVYYGTTAGTYGANPIQTVAVTAIDENEYMYAYDGANSANAGYYKTVATLSVAGGNYCFVDGNGVEITNIETTWQIEKAVLTVYSYFGGTACVNSGFSYYTGVEKTVSVQDYSAMITSHYDNNGTQTQLECTGWRTDFDLNDFVEFGLPTNYVFVGGNWQVSEHPTAVGKYKTHLDRALKEGLDANYTLVMADLEWEIYPNVFDLSAVTWDNNDTYLYGFGAPEVIGIPEGVEVFYEYDYQSPYNSGNVGENRRIITVKAYEHVDGYTGVTFTLPASGWTVDATDAYKVYSDAVFTVNKWEISLEDICLRVTTLDDSTGMCYYSPYTIPYGEYYFVYPEIAGMSFGLERDDWNSDGRGCLSGHEELGEYTINGFFWISGNPNGNFEFVGDGVEELTEDYVDGDYTLYVSSLDYPYILRFSITWSIVEEQP